MDENRIRRKVKAGNGYETSKLEEEESGAEIANNFLLCKWDGFTQWMDGENPVEFPSILKRFAPSFLTWNWKGNFRSLHSLLRRQFATTTSKPDQRERKKKKREPETAAMEWKSYVRWISFPLNKLKWIACLSKTSKVRRFIDFFLFSHARYCYVILRPLRIRFHFPSHRVTCRINSFSSLDWKSIEFTCKREKSEQFKLSLKNHRRKKSRKDLSWQIFELIEFSTTLKFSLHALCQVSVGSNSLSTSWQRMLLLSFFLYSLFSRIFQRVTQLPSCSTFPCYQFRRDFQFLVSFRSVDTRSLFALGK